MELSDDEVEELGLFRCWCGEVGKADEMLDNEVYGQGCGGTGTLHCECGGDICVCHNHGEVPCDGCDDCEHFDDDDYYSGDWDESDD